MEKQKGFGAIDPEKQRQIASLGGRTSHKKGTAHEWNPEEARKAGRKGGLAATLKRREKKALNG